MSRWLASATACDTVTDEAQMALRFGLFAGVVALVVVLPNRASGSPVRNALGVFVLAASFLSGCALLLEAVANITLYAVPVSVAAIAALLFWVIEPKISTRLRAIFPNWRTVGVSVAWVVRTLGTFGALIAATFVFLEIPLSIRAAITLASGLLFLGGLLAALARFGPPAHRRQQLRRLSGIALVVLGMTMTFGGSFGVSFLFDPYEIGTRRVIRDVLFGPVYALGLPVFLLGLWLLGIMRRRDSNAANREDTTEDESQNVG